MHPTPHAHINPLLHELQERMQPILGEKLIGLYLYGSLVTGDFDETVSDIDLLAAIATDLDSSEFDALNAMHHAFALEHPVWNDRIEIAYVPLEALQTFRERSNQIAVISPGEPFHFKEAGKEWLVNWYMVRERGITLYGAPPDSIIPPITKAEFIETVKQHITAWKDWVVDMQRRPSQAYAILTMCRGLYTCMYGEQVSKRQAAWWAAQELPEWASLIYEALRWRQAWREENVDHEATFPQTRAFVDFVIERVSNSASVSSQATD